MATFEIAIDDEKIQELLQGDRGMVALLRPILNQILQAEMTEHLGAAPEERTDDRQGYRNGNYRRTLLHICYGVLKSGRPFDASLRPTTRFWPSNA